jgi:hypothetical protein
MERLGDDPRRVLADAGLPDVVPLAELARRWPDLVGPAVARAAWPARVSRDGTLHVATTSSTWAFELDRLGPRILGRLQAALGGDAPSGLRFAPGHVPAPSAAPPPADPPAPSDDELVQGLAAAAAIEDPELRELAARAAAASLAAARARRLV